MAIHRGWPDINDIRSPGAPWLAFSTMVFRWARATSALTGFAIISPIATAMTRRSGAALPLSPARVRAIARSKAAWVLSLRSEGERRRYSVRGRGMVALGLGDQRRIDQPPIATCKARVIPDSAVRSRHVARQPSCRAFNITGH